MNTFFSVTIDDNGEMHVKSDYPFLLPSDPRWIQESDRLAKAAIKAFAKALWEDRDLSVSVAIRTLSMAETAASPEPYQSAESFWDTMMFSYLPHFESYCNEVKSPYGFDEKNITRPMRIGSFPDSSDSISMMESMFPFSSNKVS